MSNYDEKFEKQILQLAENRLNTGNFKVFDDRARIVTRRGFPQLLEENRTGDERCLVIANAEGEIVVITREFETVLRKALQGDL